MHIICCIKQVPDTAQVKIDPDTNTLIRSGVESICNPYDLVAVEAAVQLTEKHGGKVTVISMGPPQAETALREALSLGAQEAILLSDRAFAGSDTLATSYTLSRAIAKLAGAEAVQLIMCGKQAIDGDTGQTGPGIATRLGCTLFTYVSEIREIDLESGYITVKREVEGGSDLEEAAIRQIRGRLAERYPALWVKVQQQMCDLAFRFMRIASVRTGRKLRRLVDERDRAGRMTDDECPLG